MHNIEDFLQASPHYQQETHHPVTPSLVQHGQPSTCVKSVCSGHCIAMSRRLIKVCIQLQHMQLTVVFCPEQGGPYTTTRETVRESTHMYCGMFSQSKLIYLPWHHWVGSTYVNWLIAYSFLY